MTHNSVRKNHYYVHEIFDRTWAILSHLKTPEELKEMGFQMDFDWSIPQKKKWKKVQVPQLVTSSYSSSRETDEAEDIDDTAAGPAPPTDPDNAGAHPPPSRWNSSGALVLNFVPFGHLMTKGEKFELVFKRVYIWAVFCLSYNSCSSEVFVWWVVNLSPMVVWYFWTALCMLNSSSILMHACWISSDPIFDRAFQFPHDKY